jgi:hypothetical protein
VTGFSSSCSCRRARWLCASAPAAEQRINEFFPSELACCVGVVEVTVLSGGDAAMGVAPFPAPENTGEL